MANFKRVHLVQRGRALYFRIAVPRSLTAQLGRRELKFSLKITDPVLGRLRC
jgi:Domain of unknown function (DUF6538)